MPRTERRIKTIPGIGGRMEIFHKDVFESPGSGDTRLLKIAGILDIGRWAVNHKVVTTEITHSGSNGAIKRAVVAHDFTFQAACPWNSRTAVSQTVLPGFLEQILTGRFSDDYNVGLKFYLGDPLHYTDPTKFAFLWAEQALADDFRTVCDSMGKDVVRIDFSGLGNSLLECWRGIDKVFPLAETARPLYL